MIGWCWYIPWRTDGVRWSKFCVFYRMSKKLQVCGCLSAARSEGGALDVTMQETGGTAASDGAARTSLCRRRQSPAFWWCGLDVDVQEATDCWAASGGTAWRSPWKRRCTAGRRVDGRRAGGDVLLGGVWRCGLDVAVQRGNVLVGDIYFWVVLVVRGFATMVNLLDVSGLVLHVVGALTW